MLKVVGPSTVFEHLLNDPTTPALKVLAPVPGSVTVHPHVNVIGLKNGPLVQEDAIRVQAASVFTSIAFTMSWVQKIRTFDRWVGGESLTVVPRAGRDFNAYYDRWGIHFYYDLHPVTRKVVFTADSSEAVDHELGHALLDVFCPQVWDMNDVESQGFKEAFGDIISMTSSLHRNPIVEHALAETGGNLRRSNVVSRIAEEVGNAIYYKEPNSGRPRNCLRDAVEVFVYQHPDTLLQHTRFNQLSREPHNFSRVFSGAWYELFVEIFEHHRTQTSEADAIHQSRDYLAKLTLLALKRLEHKPPMYASMARAMIDTDAQEFGSRGRPFIRRVFTKRNILPPEILF